MIDDIDIANYSDDNNLFTLGDTPLQVITSPEMRLKNFLNDSPTNESKP